MPDIWTFHSAGKLVFGAGAVARLGQLVSELRVGRVFLVTDKNLQRAGVVERVCAPLKAAGLSVQIFDGGEPEPSIDLAEVALAAARDFRAEAVVGLGGGSNMDLAKVTAASLAHGAPARAFIGDCKVPGPVLPIVCLPTTSGTGSEVTAAAVLTDKASQMKVGILSNDLRPRVAVVDPELTLSCPAKVTADSGIDALTHAIEAYTAVDNERFPLPPGEKTVYQGRHPLGDCLAEKAIELVGKNLARAVREPANLEARTGMSAAATIAGLAFSNVGVALVHAMEYPVGGAVHVSHGAGNGLLLPFVMWFNLPLRQRQFARIAQLLGRDTAGMSEDDAAQEAIRAVETLKREIGIPARLRDIGVKEGQLADFAAKAFNVKRILRVNPRETTPEAIEGIYREAW